MNNINKPYLVSICSYPKEASDGLNQYLKSLYDNISIDSYELIMIGYEPLGHCPLINAVPSFRLYNHRNESYPGNLHRFDFLYDLSVRDMNPDRWIIFTDTYDVRFQKDFPDFSVFNRNEVLVANEGEQWSESTWFPTLQAQVPVNFLELLKDHMILNAGTWAMTVETFQVMYRFMIKRAEDYNNHQWSDQPIYNEFIYSGMVKPLDHPSFCTVLYKNMELGNTIKEGNKFYNRNHELYSIAHGNGSSKEYFNA